jgi:subtilisin family serine protease
MKHHKLLSHQLLLGLAVAALLFIMTGCSENPTTAPSTLNLNSTEISPSLGKVGFQGERLEYVPGELIVKFRSGVSESNRLAALKAANAEVSERIVTQAMRAAGDDEGLTVVRMPLSVYTAIDILQASSDVVFAEPNYYLYHNATSNDPFYTDGSLWGMYGDATTPANQYGSQAGEAWAAGNIGSNTVHIGVIDEGAMFTHEDLAGQIWTNPFDPEDGVDNDGNGYIDDIHGWDFDGNDNSTFDGSQDDHGTHVSGTIGAIGGNGIGVVGVSWNISMITVKFLGRRGGTTSNAIKSIDYVTDLKTRHSLNLPATNNSWGGGGFSQALQDAIERANAAEILFVAAAGNDSKDIDSSPTYPAAYPNDNIIAVASITSSGALSGFSNFGATSVDLGAPGSGIYSTLPGRRPGTSTYGSYNGTSMATPHVTGGVALYAASNPGATAATIKDAILSSTIPTSSLSGKTVTGGRLDVSGF